MPGDLPYLVAKVLRGNDSPLYASAADRNAVIVAKDETIIICDGSNSGEVFTGFSGVLSSTMGKLVKKVTVDDSYLRLFLAAHFGVLNGAKTGAAIPHLDKDAMFSLVLPLPPISEQRRIVGILVSAFEGIDAARTNTQKNLENTREVFDSQREATLAPRTGWNLSPLGDLCEIKHGFAFKGEFFRDSGEFVLLTPGNFFEQGGYRDRGDKQKFYVGEIPPGYVLKRNDMLVAMTEQAAGLLGSPLLVPESNKFLHNQRLGLVAPRQGQPWAAQFFFHVFNLAHIRKEIHDGGTGAKVRHTSPGRIQAVQVAYPTNVENQQAVAEKLVEVGEEAERLEAIYRSKLAALDDLKKSLLHRAFSGQL